MGSLGSLSVSWGAVAGRRSGWERGRADGGVYRETWPCARQAVDGGLPLHLEHHMFRSTAETDHDGATVVVWNADVFHPAMERAFSRRS
jgi:hypothetical protein